MNALLGIVLLAAAGGGDDDPAQAKRGVPISMREAVSLSLNHNLDIEVARYQPWIEEQNVYATLGAWDHVAYASGSKGESFTPGVSALSGAARLDTESEDVTFGLRKALPFGPSYDLSFSTQRIRTNSAFTLLNPIWTQTGSLGVTVPLLKGGWTTSNTATLVVARHTYQSSIDQFEKALGDSIFQVMQAYWDLVFALENKKVKEQSLEVALKLLEDNRVKFERGVVARIDVTQAESGVASQREGILTAEAAVLNTTDRLKRLTDASTLQNDVLLAPVDAPREPGAEIDEKAVTQAALTRALDQRSELRQIRQQISSQDVVLGKTGNDLLPRLDLTGRGSITGTDDSLSSANDEARSKDFHDLTVGFVFEWPLERSAAKGANRRAELEKRRLQLQERNLENQVILEVREAVRAIRTNEKRIEATRRARMLGQEQLDAEMTRRTQGLSTTFRVLDVQEDLAQARTNEIKALIDYTLSQHKLQQVTGRLLEENGIVLKENLQPRIPPGGR